MFGRLSARIDLPSAPSALAHVIHAATDKHATTHDLAAAVLTDPSLTAKVLRIANSAQHSDAQEIQTVSEAIARLGISPVRNLAASAPVVEAVLPGRMFPGFSWECMWTHCVICGFAAKAIWTHLGWESHKEGEKAFIAGLVHDIGKLVLARALPRKFARVVDACREQGCDMVQAERQILSTDHAQTGAKLAHEWNLPAELRAAIAHHHDFSVASKHPDLAAIVHAADLVARKIQGDCVLESETQVDLERVARLVGIEAYDLARIAAGVRDRFEQNGSALAWSENSCRTYVESRAAG